MNKLQVNGVELALLDQGTGPVVVLVHGFPLDHSMWNCQIDVLARNHRVLAVDLRGFGSSEVTEGVATMEHMADDIAGLLDALEIPDKVTLVGLSMGGYVALAFCRKYAARLRGLVLCDTRAEVDSNEAAAARCQTAENLLIKGTGILVDSMVDKLLAPDTFEKQPDLVENLKRMIRSTDPRGAAAATLGMAVRDDSTDLLEQIPCPVLIVVGKKDSITPPDEMRAMADMIADARIAEIPTAGHMAPMEQPTAVNQVLMEFLASLES